MNRHRSMDRNFTSSDDSNIKDLVDDLLWTMEDRKNFIRRILRRLHDSRRGFLHRTFGRKREFKSFAERRAFWKKWVLPRLNARLHIMIEDIMLRSEVTLSVYGESVQRYNIVDLGNLVDYCKGGKRKFI